MTPGHKQNPSQSAFYFLCFLLLLVALISVPRAYAEAPQLGQQERETLLSFFPDAERIGDPLAEPVSWPVLKGDEIIGYGFRTNDVVPIPAYSGKPINTLVGLDNAGVITGTEVLEHHEPILLVGIPEHKLFDFADQYVGLSAKDHVKVGVSTDPNTLSVDAVTGATVTVMVVNEAIMRSAQKVAGAHGIIELSAADQLPPATVKQDVYRDASWQELTGEGSVRRLQLTRAQVDDAFQGTEAEDVDTAAPEQKQDTFIDLYYAHLNPPTIGRNLLGKSEYDWLMSELNPGDHAIAVMANGQYSFKGSGYVRGGIFDRIQVKQGADTISFRDLDYYRLSDVYAEGIPDFGEKAIFIIRDHYAFDPGSPWGVELLVRRQTGPLDSVFVVFSGSYQVPEQYIDRPEPPPQMNAESNNQPLWVTIWQDRMFQITVVSISLVLLTAILFLQDWLVRKPRLLHTLRLGFLIYTVTFIGWYALGQLSVVNVFTFTHALVGEFRWELFLMDPVLFIIWSFTAATILLWGRGVFCGWLCPFGALQELINEAARKLKVRQFDLPFAVHERLWAVKYIILLVLFGISLESMSTAEKYAEVEPFKTAITLGFQREWWFVTYALVLLFISIFTRKVYCRYICPLGAALAIPTKLRLFDWLKRRKECGSPCQLCAVECEIRAIHPDGTINANECHHCLDCQMTYHNENKCPPLINKAKKKRKQAQAQARVKDSDVIATSAV